MTAHRNYANKVIIHSCYFVTWRSDHWTKKNTYQISLRANNGSTSMHSIGPCSIVLASMMARIRLNHEAQTNHFKLACLFVFQKAKFAVTANAEMNDTYNVNAHGHMRI